MYKITTEGVIIFPDNSTLAPPYEPVEKYLEYAEWVQAGNCPEVVNGI